MAEALMQSTSILGLPLTAIAGIAVGYIFGERSGRREEAERMAKVQELLMPKAGWQGEQTLRDFANGEVPPMPPHDKDI